jgi:hypothetical protein
MFEVFRKIFRVYFTLLLGSYLVFFVAGALFTAVMMFVLIAQDRTDAAFEMFTGFAIFAVFLGFVAWVRRDIHEQNRLRDERREREERRRRRLSEGIADRESNDRADEDWSPSEEITRRPGNQF